MVKLLIISQLFFPICFSVAHEVLLATSHSNRQLRHYPFFPAMMVINNETCLKLKAWNIIPLFQRTKLNSLMGRELTSHYINCHSASSYKNKTAYTMDLYTLHSWKNAPTYKISSNKKKLFHTCPSHYNGHSRSALMLQY
jgi:hypothetical protein